MERVFRIPYSVFECRLGTLYCTDSLSEASDTTSNTTACKEPTLSGTHSINAKMSGAGYDVVVDVDDEVRSPLHVSSAHPSAARVSSGLTQLTQLQGDLGHTDLQEDLEFHSSNFNADASSTSRKVPGASPGLPPPATTGSGSSKRFLWSLSFYAQFFDVDTSSVLSRCWAALYPRANFLDVLEGNPDLYGPFWIATTVVFILFLGGTISQYLAETGKARFAYDFKLLSGMTPSWWNNDAALISSTQVPLVSSMAIPSSFLSLSSSPSNTSAANPQMSWSAGPFMATPTSFGFPLH